MEQRAVTSDRRDVDERTIDLCQQGDKEAFRLLFECYKDRTYSIALHFFRGDEAVAKDVTQQVFLKLFTAIKQFRCSAMFTTWLYRLVINTCVDEQRRRRRFLLFGDAFEAGATGAKRSQEEQYASREVEHAVQAAIAELKPKLRVPILLKYMENLSYEEIAAVLECSKGTVASRLNRGHKILAKKLAHLRMHTEVAGE